jgi:nicotinamide mononucleotide (NMN) deamidase PncC
MVKIESAKALKDWEAKFGISFKGMMGKGGKTELFDTGRMVISLKEKERVVLIDNLEKMWELSRDKKGIYHLRKLLKKRTTL